IILLAVADMHKKYILISGGVLAVILAIVFVASVISIQKYSGTHTPAQVLAQQNQSFSSAQNYQNQGQYQVALQAYQQALPNAQDASQQATIKFRIAEATEQGGGYTEAIQLLKQLAVDTTVPAILRAYAIQEIGFMYYSYPKAQTIIANTTFQE